MNKIDIIARSQLLYSKESLRQLLLAKHRCNCVCGLPYPTYDHFP